MDNITCVSVTPSGVTGDAVTGSAVDVAMYQQLENLNNTTTAILAVILFIWIERKIKNICKSCIGSKGGAK